jgi:hypothetical protein
MKYEVCALSKNFNVHYVYIVQEVSCFAFVIIPTKVTLMRADIPLTERPLKTTCCIVASYIIFVADKFRGRGYLSSSGFIAVEELNVTEKSKMLA